MRGAVAFGMAVKGLTPGHYHIELLEHVMDYIRVSVFIDGDPGSGMGDVDDDLAGLNGRIIHNLLDISGDLDELIALACTDLEKHQNRLSLR